MTLDLVTLATVRELRGWSADATKDAVISDLITAVSERFAGEMCGRLLLKVERTEQKNVNPGQRYFQLDAWPVDTGESFTVVNDYERAFTGDAVAAADYYLQDDIGQLSFDVGLEQGRGALQVTYTAGLAATAADVESNCPDIADAVRRQVVYEFERKDSLGQTSQTLGQSQNTKSWAAPDGWLEGVKDVIMRYRRLVFV